MKSVPASAALPTSFGNAAIASARALPNLTHPAHQDHIPPTPTVNSAPSLRSTAEALSLPASILGSVIYIQRGELLCTFDSHHSLKGFWKCVGVESGTPFPDFEFENGEWVDYDEKVSFMPREPCHLSSQLKCFAMRPRQRNPSVSPR